MKNTKKRIVILGAGFVGLRSALCLEKKLRNLPYWKIILVDAQDFHLYTPDLYEIATAYNKTITEHCLTKLKDTVATPLEKILRGKRIELLRDKVIAIHPEKKTVSLKNHSALDFDYLVIGLGSRVNFYGIPGLEQHSLPLKTVTDALAVNCGIDMYFHKLWKSSTKKPIHIVIGGGGATGIEFACEIPRFLDKLCKKYEFQRDEIKISIIEASGCLAGQGKKVTSAIQKRLKFLNIEAELQTRILEAHEHEIVLESSVYGKKTLQTDMLIWTGGVSPHPLIRESFSHTAKNGSLPVNKFLQNKTLPFIFAGGDNALFQDPATGKTAPMLAQVAFEQGKIIAHNLAAEILGGHKTPFRLKLKGMIIPLGGKYALFKPGHGEHGVVIQGFWMWVLRRIVDLRYTLSILPFFYALKKWIRDTNVFVGND